MLDVKLVRKRHASYPAIFAAINRNFLPKAGVHISAAVKRNMRDAHLIDSARLINSVSEKVISDSQVKAFTNVEYAPYPEYGTYKMKARPTWRPALDNSRKFLVKLWADTYEKVFKVMGV